MPDGDPARERAGGGSAAVGEKLFHPSGTGLPLRDIHPDPTIRRPGRAPAHRHRGRHPSGPGQPRRCTAAARPKPVVAGGSAVRRATARPCSGPGPSWLSQTPRVRPNPAGDPERARGTRIPWYRTRWKRRGDTRRRSPTPLPGTLPWKSDDSSDRLAASRWGPMQPPHLPVLPLLALAALLPCDALPPPRSGGPPAGWPVYASDPGRSRTAGTAPATPGRPADRISPPRARSSAPRRGRRSRFGPSPRSPRRASGGPCNSPAPGRSRGRRAGPRFSRPPHPPPRR